MSDILNVNVGTRGSLLAVEQTKLFLSWIQSHTPNTNFHIKTVHTSGDDAIEIVGAFVKEVELELLAGNIDIAIHSLKDMPTELHPNLALSAMPVRGYWEDCLVSRHNVSFSELPYGSKIGTGSLRRIFQLRLLRPDLEFIPIRGNIITRMGKIESGLVDAVILAKAGLDRVNMTHKISYTFTRQEMLPAVAQGILAAETRVEENLELAKALRPVHHVPTYMCAIAERSFLAGVGGGCKMPMAAFAQVENNEMTIEGIYFNEDGSKNSRNSIVGHYKDAQSLGLELANMLKVELQSK
ncbi:MAG: hydroxymethylbilane synthase [Bacteroidota bacterium]|nr:hydroxymethylbilane synthase [Bacteroidota bacterium]